MPTLTEIVGREVRYSDGASCLVPEGMIAEPGDDYYRLCLKAKAGEPRQGVIVRVGQATPRSVQDSFDLLRRAMVRRQQRVAGIE